MNADMVNKIIEFGAKQERERAEFMAGIAHIVAIERVPASSLPAMIKQTVNVEAKEVKKANAIRGRKRGTAGLASQIRELLDRSEGTVQDIAMATGADSKKIIAALNSMKARNVVEKIGNMWRLPPLDIVRSDNGASHMAA